MKKLFKLLPLLVLLAAIQSCSDKLNNAQPSTAVSQKRALSSATAIKSIRTGMYAYFHSMEYTTTYMLVPEALADNIQTRVGANRLSGATANSRDAGALDAATYNTSYDIINQANLLIKKIPKGVLSHADSIQYVGEAYFVRAFVYHHMVRTLGYEPGQQPKAGDGAGWDEGVIIKTKPTLDVSDATYHPRSSVEKVYTLIISDLKNAISLLGQHDAGSQIYPSKASAEAELARVYLYERDYKNADKYATNAIADAESELNVSEATPDQVSSMFGTADLNPEGIWINKFNSTINLAGGNQNNSLNVYTSTFYVAGVPTQDVINLYSKNDKRLSWFSQCFDDVAGKPKGGCYASSPYIKDGKVKLELDKWTGAVGNYLDNVPYLRVSEQLLIQSEARLKGGFGDPAAPLNELRKDRGLQPLTSAPTMKDILDARRREFIGEGMRFYDLKRLGRDIRKAPGSGYKTVPYTSYKVLDNIPLGDVSRSKANAPKDSVLQQNPGYGS